MGSGRRGLWGPRTVESHFRESSLEGGRRSGVTEGPCTLQLKFYEEQIALPGTYAAGEYTLRVNDAALTFRGD
jgi:hypothetical protein